MTMGSILSETNAVTRRSPQPLDLPTIFIVGVRKVGNLSETSPLSFQPSSARFAASARNPLAAGSTSSQKS